VISSKKPNDLHQVYKGTSSKSFKEPTLVSVSYPCKVHHPKRGSSDPMYINPRHVHKSNTT
jgi:hypothetical protein